MLSRSSQRFYLLIYLCIYSIHPSFTAEIIYEGCEEKKSFYRHGKKNRKTLIFLAVKNNKSEKGMGTDVKYKRRRR